MYQIPEENLDLLIERLEKLQKRAEKLNCGSISWTVGKSELVKTREFGYIRVFSVDVQGDAPVIDGWSFVAKVEHLEAGNVLYKASSLEVPVRYRTTDYTLCEHCNTRRVRTFTYIVEKDGVFMQVGSTCLRDFLGHADPEALAEFAQELYGLADIVSDFEYGGDEQTYSKTIVKLPEFMAYVAMAVEEHGFVGRSKAGMGNPASADIALYHMFPSQYQEKVYPSKGNGETADAVIKYVREVVAGQELDDYLHNVVTIFAQDYIEYDHAGYAASAITLYLRHLEEKARVDDSRSEYQGVVGKRQDWTLTVTKVMTFDGYYGTSHMHIMQDDAGNVFVWSSSSYQFEIGDVVTGKGTVKEHKEYRGIKQTVLTRCKFELV